MSLELLRLLQGHTIERVKEGYFMGDQNAKMGLCSATSAVEGKNIIFYEDSTNYVAPQLFNYIYDWGVTNHVNGQTLQDGSTCTFTNSRVVKPTQQQQQQPSQDHVTAPDRQSTDSVPPIAPPVSAPSPATSAAPETRVVDRLETSEKHPEKPVSPQKGRKRKQPELLSDLTPTAVDKNKKKRTTRVNQTTKKPAATTKTANPRTTRNSRQSELDFPPQAQDTPSKLDGATVHPQSVIDNSTPSNSLTQKEAEVDRMLVRKDYDRMSRQQSVTISDKERSAVRSIENRAALRFCSEFEDGGNDDGLHHNLHHTGWGEDECADYDEPNWEEFDY